MSIPYALRLFPPVLSGDTGQVEPLENAARNWSRSIRVQGGPWQGSFSLQGSLAYLQTFFYSRLGYHIEEHIGNLCTWEGLVYEMELTVAGVRRRRSLDLVSNRVRVDYTGTGGAGASTSWATVSESVSRYGQKDEILSMSGGRYVAATANSRRDTYLAERGWPWARTVAVERPGEPRLQVSVCGYIFTANWRYVTAADNGTGNADVWISNVVSTDCEFLSAGIIKTNTLQVERTLNGDKRAWDLIQEIVGLGDGTQPWRFYVEPGRTVRYEEIDVSPRYYLRRGGVYTQVGRRDTVNPWLVQPGVFRDAEYPMRRAEPGAPWLADVRDIWVEEVEVGVESGLQLKPGDEYSEAELLAAVQEYGGIE